jgi:hypothetical protein
MRTVITIVFILMATFGQAQRACFTSEYNDQQKAADPSLASKLAAAENFLLQQTLSTARTTGNGSSIIRIPVVVHIVSHAPEQNISEAQVKSQIAALNRDFRKLNADTANTPERFKALAADVSIEFVLATADPEGRPTTGIIRVQTPVKEWSMDDKIKFSAQGGADAWDSRFYLNIWVGNMRRLAGYSSAPGSDLAKDGVVINANAFGTINTSGTYSMGRTGVHEVGHWLGLRHIWGDTYCGDDFVHDTPKQGSFTTGCPTNFRSTCNNGVTGDMYMNYMDYTNDACTNMFTLGQSNRMRANFNNGGPRYALLQTKGLNAPWNFTPKEEAPVEIPVEQKKINFYPNPAGAELTINFGEGSDWTGKELRIVSLNGTVLQKVMVTQNLQKLNLSALKAGIYVIQASNGEVVIKEKLVRL